VAEAEAQAAADAADADAADAGGQDNPGADSDPFTLDALVAASKDKDSALEDPKTVMGLVPRIAAGLESLTRVSDEARAIRLALVPLIMQVRMCFTYLGKPDEHGKGNAYKRSFNRLIVRKVHAAILAATPDSKISEDDVDSALASVRQNVLATEGRKDVAIVARGHAAGDISDADFAVWEEQLAGVNGAPRKLSKDNVPADVATFLRTSYKHAGQNVPPAYETATDKAEREAEAEARRANRPTASGPSNPAADISRVMSELIATAAGHPDILAEQLWRGLSHLSDSLLGVPGEAPSTSDVPNRIQRVIPAVDSLGHLGVFTAAAMQDKTSKESVEQYRYVERKESTEPADILSVLRAEMTSQKQAAADAAADAEADAEAPQTS